MSYLRDTIKIAERSTIRTHKTGAIIVDRANNVVSNGWSHVPHYKLRGKRSLHAEMHALARGRHLDLTGCTIWIATISGKSGNVVSARPCLDCAIALRTAGIKVAWYTLGLGRGTWMHFHDESNFEGLKVYERNSD